VAQRPTFHSPPSVLLCLLACRCTGKNAMGEHGDGRAGRHETHARDRGRRGHLRWGRCGRRCKRGENAPAARPGRSLRLSPGQMMTSNREDEPAEMCT
jgi:hypothetical protein